MKRVLTSLALATLFGKSGYQSKSRTCRRFAAMLIAVLASAVSGLNAAPPAGNFATNLLANGDIEQGAGQLPASWTFVGKSDKDWTEQEIARFHLNGRPDFSIGRARGEWTRDQAYAGKGGLLLESIDPPLAPPHSQWHGRNPVDGFWLSDPIPCTPGQAYVSGGWLKATKVKYPGREESSGLGPFDQPWFGPFEIRFYNADGKLLEPAAKVRGMQFDKLPIGVWTYAATLPYTAPEDAKTMRLRFGHECSADNGGWGVVLADNLALWALPKNAPVPVADANELFDLPPYVRWFREATAEIKPPYFPSPTGATSPASCWGNVENIQTGNLFYEPAKPATLRMLVMNLCGEERRIALRVTRTDWLGNDDGGPLTVPAQSVAGFTTGVFNVTMPPAGRYGAFHLDIEALEGDSGPVIGMFNGRYAVLPELNRPRTARNIWAVTALTDIYADGRPFEKELGELLKIGGFGVAWVRLENHFLDPANSESIAIAQKELVFYRDLGMRCVLQIYGGQGQETFRRPLELDKFEAAGRTIAQTFKDQVVAIGNWGVEQSNHRPPEKPIYRPFEGGKMMSDAEYDEIMVAYGKGIRSAAPKLPMLIGNLATTEADVRPEKQPGKHTILRMYGAPVNGMFDGAILNTYWGEHEMINAALAEFDKHGDKHKTLWIEENNHPRSPKVGEKRRYEEGKGADNMVRWRIAMAAKYGERIQAITMWGFRLNGDWGMVTPDLQPRPQFVAQAVMADALADAVLTADRSTKTLNHFEYKRSDGPLAVAWTNAGEQDVTFETKGQDLTVMDIMGNRHVVQSQNGSATIKIGRSPLYISGPSANPAGK